MAEGCEEPRNQIIEGVGMKVYVLTEGFFDEGEVVNVYTDEAMAEKEHLKRLEANKKACGYGVGIEEAELIEANEPYMQENEGGE